LHIGPLIARSPTVASLLLALALVGTDGPVSIDVPDAQSGFLEVLAEAGFRPLRPFTACSRERPRNPAT
jgi:hypothetical protein